MSNKRKIYIHCGAPKTGTSSLQQFLFENFSQGKQKDFLYPSPRHYGKFAAPAHHHLRLQAGDSHFDHFGKLFAEIRSEENQAKDIVLSSEIFFWRANGKESEFAYFDEFLKGAQQYFDVFFVYYLRDIDSHLERLFYELRWSKPHRRTKKELKFELFVEQYLQRGFDWSPVAEFFLNYDFFEDKEVIIRSYDLCDNVVSDFLSVIGCDFDYSANSPKTLNRTPSSAKDAFIFATGQKERLADMTKPIIEKLGNKFNIEKEHLQRLLANLGDT